MAPATPHTSPIGLGGSSMPTIIEPLCATFRRALKKQGLKYTPERARILEAVTSFNAPFQAEQLIAVLKKLAANPGPGQPPFRVSKATVYRTIKLLQEAGVLQQVLFHAEHAHYQLAYGSSSTGIIVRTDSAEIIPFDAPELTALARRLCAERGLNHQGQRFVVYAVDGGGTGGKSGSPPIKHRGSE